MSFHIDRPNSWPRCRGLQSRFRRWRRQTLSATRPSKWSFRFSATDKQSDLSVWNLSCVASQISGLRFSPGFSGSIAVSVKVELRSIILRRRSPEFASKSGNGPHARWSSYNVEKLDWFNAKYMSVLHELMNPL
jgi:hypothetical protein